MTLRVVGAGVGRTGTKSLSIALAKLFDAPCYHMTEVFAHPEHIGPWHAAARGEMPDWNELFSGYAAAVDWPASAFWHELSVAFPDALVVLSLRDADTWWESADQTILPAVRAQPQDGPPFMKEWHEMVVDMFAVRFTGSVDDRASSIAAFEKHNAAVREGVARERLLEWRAGEGWEPLCRALDLPIPEEPFPRSNTREDWTRVREARAR